MEKKRVLFIGIGFYDYEDSIKREFEKLDYEVDYFCEVPANNLAYRFHSRMKNKKKIQKINRLHVINIANRCDINYDLVFVIKCENMTVDALKIIKDKNPKTKFVLYLWDSIQRISNVESKFEYFDKVYSFDRLDCVANQNLIFNPLFFRDEYAENNQDINIIYDIYHLGWYHSDRMELVKKIAKFCNENVQKYHLLLLTGYFSYYLHKFTKGKLRGNSEFLIFNIVPAKVNVENILSSRIILDIAHPLQSGLTMRTIELLGLQRKLITTNSDVINYDFYNSTNIFVIDRDNPELDMNFFNEVYRPIPDDVRLKYSIGEWLKRIVGNNFFVFQGKASL